MRPESSYPAESGAKLGIKSGPADIDIPREGMQAVGEPDVNVDHHAARPYGAESGFADRHRMLAESAIEILVQQHPVLPKLSLLFVVNSAGHGDLGLDEAATALDLSSRTVGKEGQGAPGNPAGLSCHQLISRAADGKAHIA